MPYHDLIWWICFVASGCIYLWIARTTSPQHAIGVTFALSLLIPSWVEIEVFEQPLPYRLAAQAFAIGAYCFHKKAVFPLKLGLLDLLLISLVMVHIVSDTWNSGWTWTIPLRAYCEWGIPYIAGRLCFCDRTYPVPLALTFAAVAVTISTLSLFEGLTHYHPWEMIFGERPFDDIPRNTERWGMLRAWGQSKHPIFLGLTIVLLQPWILMLFSVWTSLRARLLLSALLVLSIAGIAATGSRAAILASFLLILLSFANHLTKWKKPFYIAVAASLVVALVFWDQTWKLAHVWSGEESLDKSNRVTLEIDGEKVESSSTMGRLNLYMFYKKAMWEGGFLGFGTERTDSFPVDVPVGSRDELSRTSLRFVDNHYILITLRFGWLGFASFVGILITPIIQSRLYSRGSCAASDCLCISQQFSNAILAATLAILTVWLAFDFGQMLLFAIGTIACFSQAGAKLKGIASH
jgi:hypothetical protein